MVTHHPPLRRNPQAAPDYTPSRNDQEEAMIKVITRAKWDATADQERARAMRDDLNRQDAR